MDSQERSATPTVPRQAYGYSFQYTRLTAILFKAAAESICSFEVLDDIAEEDADAITSLHQIKSASTNNPISDHAVNLWKTMNNWLNAVKNGSIDPDKTKFIIYLSDIFDGNIVKSFHEANSAEKAKKALSEARETIWGEAPDYPNKESVAQSLASYVNPFLEENENNTVPIILGLELICGSGSSYEDLESIIRTQHPIPEPKIPIVINYLCGWVKRKVDEHIERGELAYISKEEFHREYTSFFQKLSQESILSSFSTKPSRKETEERLQDIFVQQLHLIEHDFEKKLEAISDFMRACSDRVHWSQQGSVHQGSFNELDENLRKVWQNNKEYIEIVSPSLSEVKHGKLLNLNCMKYHAKLQGMEVPFHFTPGCFHLLANNLVIGWHPDYTNIIKDRDE